MPTLKVCQGRSCSDHGSKYLVDRAQAEAQALGLELVIENCGCLDKCDQAPTVVLEHHGQAKFYHQMTGPKLAQLLKK